jgi:hypothetical protein
VGAQSIQSPHLDGEVAVVADSWATADGDRSVAPVLAVAAVAIVMRAPTTPTATRIVLDIVFSSPAGGCPLLAGGASDAPLSVPPASGRGVPATTLGPLQRRRIGAELLVSGDVETEPVQDSCGDEGALVLIDAQLVDGDLELIAVVGSTPACWWLLPNEGQSTRGRLTWGRCVGCRVQVMVQARAF